jgi:hypothetical protein
MITGASGPDSHDTSPPPDDAFADQTPGRLARLVGWLRDVPVADAVDCRNAAMLQVLLILAGLYQPLVVGYSWMHLGSLVMDVTSSCWLA